MGGTTRAARLGVAILQGPAIGLLRDVLAALLGLRRTEGA